MPSASSVAAKRAEERAAAKSKPLIFDHGEVREPDASFFARAKRGRPDLPAAIRKRRVNLMLDPDIANHLKAVENASALVNSLLREKLSIRRCQMRCLGDR